MTGASRGSARPPPGCWRTAAGRPRSTICAMRPGPHRSCRTSPPAAARPPPCRPTSPTPPPSAPWSNRSSVSSVRSTSWSATRPPSPARGSARCSMSHPKLSKRSSSPGCGPCSPPARAVLPAMMARRRGSLVVVSSQLARSPKRGTSALAMAKGAVEAAARAMAAGRKAARRAAAHRSRRGDRKQRAAHRRGPHRDHRGLPRPRHRPVRAHRGPGRARRPGRAGADLRHRHVHRGAGHPRPSAFQVTVRDVADAPDASRACVVHAMAQATWAAWSAHHRQIRAWLAQATDGQYRRPGGRGK